MKIVCQVCGHESEGYRAANGHMSKHRPRSDKPDKILLNHNEVIEMSVAMAKLRQWNGSSKESLVLTVWSKKVAELFTETAEQIAMVVSKTQLGFRRTVCRRQVAGGWEITLLLRAL